MVRCKHDVDVEEEGYCSDCEEEYKDQWLNKHGFKGTWIGDSVRAVPRHPAGEFYIRELLPSKMHIDGKHEAEVLKLLNCIKTVFSVQG
jgi:hypothetical protein